MTKANVQILTIGDELLRGELVDTNANWLADQIAQLGGRVTRIVSIGDAEQDIAEAVRSAAEMAAWVITTGGLGPTDDDRTAAAVARAAGVDRCRDEAAIAAIRARFARSSLPYSPNNDRQAYLPVGAQALPNERGTAPGFSLDLGVSRLFCFPGVPSEMRWMYETYAAPVMSAALGAGVVGRRIFKLFGLGESQVDAQLQGVLDAAGHGRDLSLHYRATFPEVHVTLIGRAAAEQQLEPALDAVCGAIDGRVGRNVFARGDESYGDAVVAALRGANATVALAESCTGGGAGDLLTAAAGASDVFELGVVAYANHVKQAQLGVPAAVLAHEGAVSRPCVEAMARGIRAKAGATYGLAISGVAGPGGGTPGKPVGTVHFALATERDVRHLMRVFPFSRRRNKLVAAYVAYWLLLERLGAIGGLGGRWAPQQDRTLQDGTLQDGIVGD